MKAAALTLVAAITIAAVQPSPAMADARDYPGRLGDGPRVRGSGRTDFERRPDFGRRHHFQRAPIFIVPSTVIVGPADAYAAPPPAVFSPAPLRYAPPVSYPPPSSYAPPPSSYAPPPPPPPNGPPEPQVVEFDSGRYELRGDGLREPYLWVWVPKAPSAPPGMSTARRPPATVYRWTDENGVVTLTDDPMKVPPQFRATNITPR